MRRESYITSDLDPPDLLAHPQNRERNARHEQRENDPRPTVFALRWRLNGIALFADHYFREDATGLFPSQSNSSGPSADKGGMAN